MVNQTNVDIKFYLLSVRTGFYNDQSVQLQPIERALEFRDSGSIAWETVGSFLREPQIVLVSEKKLTSYGPFLILPLEDQLESIEDLIRKDLIRSDNPVTFKLL